MRPNNEPGQLSLVPEREVFSVSHLNRLVRQRLESGFRLLWVEGEISNLRRPASGHWYFTLKDDRAQVRCAMFAGRNRLVAFRVNDGQRVIVQARISVYEPRGEYQLTVDQLEEAGEGALRRAFEELKKKLAAEGLFDEQGKQPLPVLPQRIGVITSDSGAALRDVLKVLRNRFPAVPVMIYPVTVQGERAPTEIVRALSLAAQRAECDVLILTRGGGSLEDLQAFNEEHVARAVAACPIPLICGVGHEIDVTIADFAADRRAPTPSAAAEMAVPDVREWLGKLLTVRQQLVLSMQRSLELGRQRTGFLQKRLQTQHPGRRLLQQGQRLDELEHRLQTTLRHQLRQRHSQLQQLQSHLLRYSPRQRLTRASDQIGQARLRLVAACQSRLAQLHRRLSVAARALDAVSPLATLQRGYAIVTVKHGKKSVIVRDVAELDIGNSIEARIARGRFTAQVTGKQEKD